jgi:hypothetical protein
MRTLALSVGAMVAHVSCMLGMYYVGLTANHPVVQNPVVVFYLPTLVAFGVHSTVARRSSRAVRFVGAGVLTVAGFVLSLLIVLSVWGS